MPKTMFYVQPKIGRNPETGGGEISGAYLPAVRYYMDDDPDLIEGLVNNISIQTRLEPDLVAVDSDIIRNRLIHGRTIVVCDGDVDCREPVSTVNITKFGPIELRGFQLPTTITELSTGVTQSNWRDRGIMSKLLDYFGKEDNHVNRNNFDALVFGTIKPDNKKIRHALLNAGFYILDQDGYTPKDFLKSKWLKQEDYAFAAYLLHMWPADPKFGVRNLLGAEPTFASSNSKGIRTQSLALSSLCYPALINLDSDLRVIFENDLGALSHAINNVRKNVIATAGAD